MQNFYQLELATSGTSAPHILGLSASPVINAKIGGLRSIEQNLNARAVTPRTYRIEMRQHVSRPILERRLYPKTQAQIGDEGHSALQCLMDAYKGFEIMQDPYVKELQESKDPGASKKLQKVLYSWKTYCHEQMRLLCTKAMVICAEVGPWAVEWYLIHCIDRFNAKLEVAQDLLPEWTENEKLFLRKHLEDVRAMLPVCMSSLESGFSAMLGVSPKVQTLVDLLIQEANPSFTGIIFVDQRATVAALAQVLSNIAEVVEPHEQQQELLDFRVGRKNLIIATLVLEEGIDVPACSITICFDEPKNLVSFIQRRGRARKQNSKYVILIPDLDSTATPERWLSLEKDMKEAYEDESRESQLMVMGQDTEEPGERTMRLQSTGQVLAHFSLALLTLENAIQHLCHFCATLQAGNHVNLRPEFSITEDETTRMITAEVILPTLVDPSVRRACSLKPWQTERMARKDAAFQAFVALHRAGLVNDNLLPLLRRQEDTPAMNTKDGGPTRVSVAERVDPWISVAQAHRDPKLWFKTLITLKAKDEETMSMVMLLPCAVADQSDFTLHWNENVEYTVHIKLLAEIDSSSTECEDIVAAKEITHLILWSVYRSRMPENRRDYPALFVPNQPGVALRIWADQMRGSRPAEDIRSTGSSLHSPGLVYEYGRSESPQVFAGFDQITVFDPELQSDLAVPQLRVMSLPKRRNFLHRIPVSAQHRTDSQSTLRFIAVSSASIGNLPFRYSLFALFVPSILHRYELLMLVDGLCNSILSPIGICNRRLVLTALTASSVGEGIDYQSLEFLGDCILKLCTSVQLASQHRNWPESYLTAEKSRTNANSYLAKAALRTGLDRYIITLGLTGVKWRPRYNNEILAPRKESRTLRSTKVLADVVEALIGASFADGGFEKAQMCIGVFLPDEQWAPLEDNRTVLFDAATVLRKKHSFSKP
ncbi:hypothetical protein B0A49_11784 [Cryomyces minteri]|uniref:Dicer-like protein 2 n=1 Tax=Cryomyces minteri TaxID=331657 RepID=A0A4U0VTL1_9PEZI|nr:hypothetical protein B0A49_11784 [Cryomyces minteri]